MTIRKKLRAQAHDKILTMAEKVEKRAIEVCGDTPIDPKELCRLVANPQHSKTLMSQLQTKIADDLEKEILGALGASEATEQWYE